MAKIKKTLPIQSLKGKGGELHQQNTETALTDNFGHVLSDNQNSLKAGERGASLLEDAFLREKIFHFDHERIPERIVHARGSGAHGIFECTTAIPELTKASIFSKKGETCEVFVRFSTVAGGAGSVDTPRDVRGFATKFYTEEGNWDLVGNNIPVFFIQDAIKFPDLVHAVKMEADKGYPQAASAHDTFWDFISLMPESMHMVMWAMSDRTIPRSLRMIEGFGVHTFRFVNAQGKGTFVKFHWRPRLGLQSTVWDEAVKLAGADPDFHRRDLHEAIEAGNFPEWDLGIQTFDDSFATNLPYDVLDATKLIPEEILPLRIIGKMTLNRNPDNFFAETEQVAFLPSNVPPGIDFTNDPLLQGRLFSYLDTQKSRLGTTNFHQIPINAPKCPFANMQRDGMMQMMRPKGRANYEPNSLHLNGEIAGPRAFDDGFHTFEDNARDNNPGEKLRIRPESFADHFTQARMFYKSQADIEQGHIASALTFELSKVTLAHVQNRVIGQLRNIDQDLAERVAKGVGVALPPIVPAAKPPQNLPISDALSIVKKKTSIAKGRKLGILFSDGSDSSAIKSLKAAAEKLGTSVMLIAPRLKGIKTSSGPMDADGQLAGTPSCTVDAIAVILTEKAAQDLCSESAAVQFIADAYAHLKGIGFSSTAKALIDKAGVVPDEGIFEIGAALVKNAGERFYEREKKVRHLS